MVCLGFKPGPQDVRRRQNHRARCGGLQSYKWKGGIEWANRKNEMKITRNNCFNVKRATQNWFNEKTFALNAEGKTWCNSQRRKKHQKLFRHRKCCQNIKVYKGSQAEIQERQTQKEENRYMNAQLNANRQLKKKQEKRKMLQSQHVQVVANELQFCVRLVKHEIS